MAQEVHFHIYEAEGKSFAFKKPSVEQIDLTTAKARKGAVSAAIGFTKAVVVGDKAAWEAYLAEKPGAAVEVMEDVLEKLGFPNRG